jgi:hypothetical protein
MGHGLVAPVGRPFPENVAPEIDLPRSLAGGRPDDDGVFSSVFSSSVNDFTAGALPIVLAYQATLGAGTPAIFLSSQERALAATTYPRIPGVDGAEAVAVVAALKATGVWDAQGARVVPDIATAVAQAQTAVLPASIYADGLANAVSSETARLLAVHQFTSEFFTQVDTFFDTYVPA